jgi:hypothetical protein
MAVAIINGICPLFQRVFYYEILGPDSTVRAFCILRCLHYLASLRVIWARCFGDKAGLCTRSRNRQHTEDDVFCSLTIGLRRIFDPLPTLAGLALSA